MGAGYGGGFVGTGYGTGVSYGGVGYGGGAYGGGYDGGFPGRGGRFGGGFGVNPPRPVRELPEGRSVYIRNLSFHTNWQELKDFLRPIGGLIRADIVLNQDGRPSGSGTAVFDSFTDAQNAIKELNNTMLDGRRVFLEEYRLPGNRFQQSRADMGAGDRYAGHSDNRQMRDMQMVNRDPFIQSAIGGGSPNEWIYVANVSEFNKP